MMTEAQVLEKLDNFKEAIKKLKGAKEDLQNRNQELESKVESLETALKTSTETIENLKLEKADLKISVENYKQAQEAFDKEAEVDIEQFKAKIADYENLIESLSDTNLEYRTENSKLQKDYENTVLKNQYLEDQNELLKKTVSKKDEELEKFKKEIESLKNTPKEEPMAEKKTRKPRVKKTEEELKAAEKKRRDDRLMLEKSVAMVNASASATSSYQEPELPPKPQLKVFSEPDVPSTPSTPKTQQIVNKGAETIHKYRFGSTTQESAKKMGILIDHIFNTVADISNFSMSELDPSTLPISSKAFDLLFERLLSVTKDDIKVLEHNPLTDTFNFNFDKQTLKDYLLEELKS